MRNQKFYLAPNDSYEKFLFGSQRVKTYDKDCITDIQISIRQLLISMDIDTRKMKYISKLKLS